MDIRNGNCLELMKTLPDKSVDLFVCDLPYGETNCKWDSKIDMEEFWSEFKRIRKSPRTACIHFCSTKFGYTLIKSWEKGFKMDMVWKKRNKTGGLQSKNRPMRNHEMVYFFYDQAPKYNRDKYHKRIQAKLPIVKDDKQIMGKGYAEGQQPPNPASVVEETDPWGCKNGGDKGAPFGLKYEPPNPASVVEEEKPRKSIKDRKGVGMNNVYTAEHNKEYLKKYKGFEPKQPTSVVEESDIYGETKSQMKARGKGHYHEFEPPNPASVLEEAKQDPRINSKGLSAHGWDIKHMDKPRVPHFEPKLPASVVEEEDDVWGQKKWKSGGDCGRLNEDGSYKQGFQPPNPASVVVEEDDELIEPAEDEPKSMYESTKVFIGKRNHQTEKPQDILEFFLKYWTDEDQVVCDPTMGSGSTGVACKKLNRKFIGFELDPKIFEVAKKRIEKDLLK